MAQLDVSDFVHEVTSLTRECMCGINYNCERALNLKCHSRPGVAVNSYQLPLRLGWKVKTAKCKDSHL